MIKKLFCSTILLFSLNTLSAKATIVNQDEGSFEIEMEYFSIICQVGDKGAVITHEKNNDSVTVTSEFLSSDSILFSWNKVSTVEKKYGRGADYMTITERFVSDSGSFVLKYTNNCEVVSLTLR